MKRVAPLMFMILSVAYASAQFLASSSISFYQDPLVSNKIYAEIHLLTDYAGGGFQNNVISVNWGDTTTSIALSDTLPDNRYPGLYDMTFVGSHIYSSSYMDSIVTISTQWTSAVMDIYIENYETSNPYNPTSFIIQATANLHALKNSTGYNAPAFDTSLFTDTEYVNQELIYDPRIRWSNSDSTYILLTYPPGGGFMPNIIYRCPDTSLTANDTTGVMDWSRPCEGGFYMVTFLVSQYKGDTLVSTVMRDIMFDVVDTAIMNTSIKNVDLNMFTISPDPVTDKLIINTSLSDLDLTIYDMSGQIIAVPVARNEIDVSALPSGVYLIVINSGEGKKTIKFTKL